ncbi:MAG: hypothetical protein ACLFM1_10380 [Bacteroidales bacterium]
MRKWKIILLLLAGIPLILPAQNRKTRNQPMYIHSLETSPLSPVLQMANVVIRAIKYEYALTDKDGLKTGLAYMNNHFDIGNTNSPGVIIGYRRFLWKKLYVEYVLWPAFDAFYEKHSDPVYKGFDLWNEFRMGYQFILRLKTSLSL